MIRADDFITPARALGFNTWAGVPCSFLTPFINAVIDTEGMSYVSAANEGDAVAIASGAALAGQRSVALMQNSGLGNAVSPLSSLNWVFRIPVLLIVTLRGEPGLADEPQHELMGQITGKILDDLQIPWDWFPRTPDEVEGALTVAQWHMDRSGLPYAFVMKKGSVEKTGLRSAWQPATAPRAVDDALLGPFDPQMTRQDVLREVVAHTPPDDSLVIGTTGYTGRELFAIEDRPNQLYMVGSMGCASSFALGLSRALPDRRVVVADGDGAALMRMGNFATIGAYGPANLRHLVLDNGVHESTGGQATVSPAISFAGVARACGYRAASAGSSRVALDEFLGVADGPALLHFRTRRGVPEGLPRPDVRPREVKQRLMRHIGAEAPWRDH
jgi:phosphonopyruvate decarboxylase